MHHFREKYAQPFFACASKNSLKPKQDTPERIRDNPRRKRAAPPPPGLRARPNRPPQRAGRRSAEGKYFQVLGNFRPSTWKIFFKYLEFPPLRAAAKRAARRPPRNGAQPQGARRGEDTAGKRPPDGPAARGNGHEAEASAPGKRKTRHLPKKKRRLPKKKRGNACRSAESAYLCNRKMRARRVSLGSTPRAGPFVYRLGREIFIL